MASTQRFANRQVVPRAEGWPSKASRVNMYLWLACLMAFVGSTDLSRRAGGRSRRRLKDLALRHSFRQSGSPPPCRCACLTCRTRPGPRSCARASKPNTAAVAKMRDAREQRPNSFTPSNWVTTFSTSGGRRCILQQSCSVQTSCSRPRPRQYTRIARSLRYVSVMSNDTKKRRRGAPMRSLFSRRARQPQLASCKTLASSQTRSKARAVAAPARAPTRTRSDARRRAAHRSIQWTTSRPRRSGPRGARARS